ncbi:MAG TPA: hypothetical protein VF427_12560 [Noviherbaspirillum sp.]
MRIFDSVLGKREPVIKYRTIDGGHPAPYPDMTDEQLYNYETAFNVPKKTFEKPPPEVVKKEQQARTASRTSTARRTTANRQETAPRQPEEQATLQPPVQPPLDFSKPVRTVTTKQPVEIITTKARHPVFKVLGYIGEDQVATMFTLQGQISENGLVFLENMPQKQILYLNIYPNRSSLGNREKFFLTQHETREVADAAATAERIACVPLQFAL